MTDSSIRRSAGSSSYRRQARHSRANQKPAGPGITVIQSAVCAVVLAAAILIRFFGGTVYIKLQNYFHPALRNSISAGEANQAFNHFKNNFPDAVSVFNNLTKSASSKASGQAVSSRPASSAPSLNLPAVSGSLPSSAVLPGIASSSKTASSSKSSSSSARAVSSKAASKTAGASPTVKTAGPV